MANRNSFFKVFKEGGRYKSELIAPDTMKPVILHEKTYYEDGDGRYYCGPEVNTYLGNTTTKWNQLDDLIASQYFTPQGPPVERSYEDRLAASIGHYQSLGFTPEEAIQMARETTK